MNVLFCNITWMKYYEGVTDDDKPKNGGAYIKENEYGGECYNFLDYNGKCHGFVQLYGNMNLELHFKDAKKNYESLKDVLVIWVATNDTKETRIVGWYKNATIYREEQLKQSFTHEEHNLYYSIEALSKDCYLLPEKQRTFPIQRATQSGKGTGLGRSNVWYADSSFGRTVIIPKVIEYVDNYTGEFANKIYTDDILNETIGEGSKITAFNKLYDEGIKCFEHEKCLDSLRFLNTARAIKETDQVLYGIANSLYTLYCFDKAIPLFEKVIDLEGSKVEILWKLVYCYDLIGDRKKTIEYFERLVDLLDDSKEAINDKMYSYCIMFDIYISLRDKKNASEITNKIIVCCNDDKAQECVKRMKDIIENEFPE